MSVTMKEIAYICGVSRGTVDRVLNRRGNVKKETSDKIFAVAEKMGYRTQITDSILLTPGRKFKIGILINASGHPYFAEILSGALKTVESLADYNITSIVKISEGFDVDQQIQQLDDLLQQEVDAIIITPANNSRIRDKLNNFNSSGIPVVIISAILDDYEPFTFVGSNHYMSGRIAAGISRLIVSNPKEIAIVTSFSSSRGVSLRLKGYMDVMAEACPHASILEPVQSFDDDVIAYKMLSGLLSRHPNIDILFLAAGGFSGCYQAVEEAALTRKPKIIAFDLQGQNSTQLKKGVVSAILFQNPTLQGETAIRILSDYFLKKSIPDRKVYIKTQIIVAEALDNIE